MAGFSPSDAAFEGFRLIARHWRVVVGWALFNLVALVAMVVVTVVVAIGVTAGAGAGATQLSANVGGLVATLGAAVIEAILVTGVFRLMLKPETPAFLHLRLGWDEIRLILVWAAMAIAVFLLIGAGVIASSAAGKAGIVVLLAAVVIAVWLGLRVSLAPVASFAERGMGFASAWRLSRGHVWSLLGMAVLALCFVALVVLAATLVLVLVVGFSAGFGSLFAVMAGGDAIRTHPGLYLGDVAFELILTPVIIVLASAPAAAAYRALRAEPAA